VFAMVMVHVVDALIASEVGAQLLASSTAG
jgi:hypothetical protein